MKRSIASSAIGIAICAVLSAQAPPIPQGAPQPGPAMPRIPPRDGAAAEATGTARIRGRVVAADNGTPLRRAQVRVSAAELRLNRSVNTDAEGRYEFTELPAGRYNIFVTRNGFVSLQFGQRRPFESGRPLDVADAQIVEKIDFALPRGGVIAGRVTDELGEPLAGIRMQAMRYQYLPNGQRQLTPVGGVGMPFGLATNDLGEFRLYSLMPGTYIVSAAPMDVGGMIDRRAASASGAPNDGHGITYYPGTINVDEAQSITVGLSEVANATFALVPQRMTRINGIVRDSQGKPMAATLSLRTQSGASMSMRQLAMAGAGWTVQRCQRAARRALRRSLTAARRRRVRIGANHVGWPGHHRPRHHDELRGRRSLDKLFSKAERRAGPKSLRVNASSPDPGGPQPTRIYDNTQGVVDEKADSRFEGCTVACRLQYFSSDAGCGAPGWFLKSVTIDGENVTDVPFDVSTARDDTKSRSS